MIEPEEEGIGLDDISFDDVIGGGSESSEVAEDLAIEQPSAEAEELDADAEELEESEDVEEIEEEEEEYDDEEEDEDYEEDEEYEDDDDEEEYDEESASSTVVASKN